MTTTLRRSRSPLPQLTDRVFLTDGGIETTLIYHQGLALPEFAAFVLLDDEQGREQLRHYYRPYLDLARRSATGIVLETATWRASRDWGQVLGYSPDALAGVNREAVELLEELRLEYATSEAPVVISGCIGPRGDGYAPESLMDVDEAREYHDAQISTFAQTSAELVTALTMTHTAEAIGVVRAAAAHGIASVISFTVETDGRLPSGETLEEAVRVTDAATDGAPAYYMVNCAHPTHVDSTLVDGRPWNERVRGFRGNASTLSHEELDAADSLDIGDIEDFGSRSAALHKALPHLTVLGGCCGTDERHLEAVRRSVSG
jgi:homocysteine S-methyltransferase